MASVAEEREPDLFDERLTDEPALAWRSLPGGGDFAAELERLRLRASAPDRAIAIAVAALASGPVAIGAAFVNNSSAGGGLLLLVPILIAPVVEEIAKASGALYLAERKPWLVPASWALIVVCVTSALVFATVENVYYLALVGDDASRTVESVRWIGGTSLHTSASLVAGFGVARMWRRCMRVGRPADFGDAQPFLIVAMVIHGTWNLVATIVAVATAL